MADQAGPPERPTWRQSKADRALLFQAFNTARSILPNAGTVLRVLGDEAFEQYIAAQKTLLELHERCTP